jgi:hypothetical protein
LKAAVTRSPSALTSAALMATRISIASAGSLQDASQCVDAHGEHDACMHQWAGGWASSTWGAGRRVQHAHTAWHGTAQHSAASRSQGANCRTTQQRHHPCLNCSPQLLDQVRNVALPLQPPPHHLNHDLEGAVGPVIQKVVLLRARRVGQGGKRGGQSSAMMRCASLVWHACRSVVSCRAAGQTGTRQS